MNENKILIAKTLFIAAVACIILFSFSAGTSLAIGLFIGLTFTNPFSGETKIITKYLLQVSVIGLGFGMNFTSIIQAGKDGFVFTLLTISAAIGGGYLLGRFLKVRQIISYLIICGTAICGGSAIAAISQVVKADEKEISISIGIIFILNAVALFIFPPIGAYFHLTQKQFGIWSAIAIHDTSSVVGAAARYGNEALQIATTVKLARALWIVPLALLSSFLFKKESSASAFPYFILLFVLASMVNSYTSFISKDVSNFILKASKMGFSITLFLIGAGISVNAIRKVGARPLLQGILLWIFILVVSLALIMHYS